MSDMDGLCDAYIECDFYTSIHGVPWLDSTAPLCVATGTLIVKGQESRGVSRFLSAPFMVWVGLLSYSLYMWHWPVISFMRHYFIDLEMQHILFAIVVTFALSMISRHLIEKPMMVSGASFKRSFLLVYILPASIIVSVSWLIISSDGVYSRYSNDEQMLLRTSEAVGHHCARSLPYDNPNPDCLIGEETTEPKAKVLLWGDSHANHFQHCKGRINVYACYF